MRRFDLHPVEFRDGRVVEHPAIGALLLDEEGFEFEWEDPGAVESMEERLEEILEAPVYSIGPHPDPTMRATVRTELEVGSAEWLAEIGDLLEGPDFRLRLREVTR